MCEGTLHWTAYFKAIGPTIIAIFVAYIAYQQWKLRQADLREKLFDRRFAVFKQTQAFLSSIFRDAICDDDALGKFHDAPQMAQFLFGKEIQTYLEEIRKHALKARLAQKKCSGLPIGPERSELIEQEHVHLEWLSDQLGIIFDKFEPYLGFEKNR